MMRNSIPENFEDLFALKEKDKVTYEDLHFLQNIARAKELEMSNLTLVRCQDYAKITGDLKTSLGTEPLSFYTTNQEIFRRKAEFIELLMNKMKSMNKDSLDQKHFSILFSENQNTINHILY